MTSRVTRTAAVFAASALMLTGCAMGGDGGGEVGFNAFSQANATEMPGLCEELFGNVESVGKRFDTEVYPQDPMGNSCLYETSSGEMILLGISETKPNATVVGRGDKYYAFAEYSFTPAPDVAKEIGPWLERRAAAIQDDLETWIEELPHAEESFATVDEGLYDEGGPGAVELSSLNGLLLTPASRVFVSGISKPTFVMLASEATQPAEGYEFVNVEISISALELQGAPSATYHVEADGKELDSATAMLDRVVAGASSRLLLSVPVGTSALDLVATIDSDVQRVSLLTGVVDDDERSERLALATQGSLEFVRSRVTATNENGYDEYLRYSDPYSNYASWVSTPYSTSLGWTKAGEHYFTIALEPDSPEAALELTTSDISLVINGQDYKATTYDPSTHSFTFVIPDTTSRAKVTYQATIDTSVISRWKAGFTLSGPETNVASVDFHASGSAIYPSGMGSSNDYVEEDSSGW